MNTNRATAIVLSVIVWSLSYGGTHSQTGDIKVEVINFYGVLITVSK